MELSNEFTVAMPIDDAWGLFTDLARIAPCMPGAHLQSVEGEEYHGVIKVKVGPVTVEYKGKAVFLERNTSTHRAVLRAEGRETRGQGNASATIIAQLQSEGTSTRVSVMTTLAISGKVAQFGRGVLTDVSTKLLGQFVDSLEAMGLGRAGSVAATDAAESVDDHYFHGSPGARTVASYYGYREVTNGNDSQVSPAAPVDLIRLAGPAVVKRFAGALAALVAVMFFWRRFHHSARRRSTGSLRGRDTTPPLVS